MLAGTQAHVSTWATHRYTGRLTHRLNRGRFADRPYRQTHTGMLAKIKALVSDLQAIFIQNHIKTAFCQEIVINNRLHYCLLLDFPDIGISPPFLLSHDSPGV